jgi:hypothetical protein
MENFHVIGLLNECASAVNQQQRRKGNRRRQSGGNSTTTTANCRTLVWRVAVSLAILAIVITLATAMVMQAAQNKVSMSSYHPLPSP